MPNWLQIALIVLAAFIVLYGVLVIGQIVAATVLRRQYEPTRRQIESAQQEVTAAKRKLDQLAPFIASGSREMPFGPLYEQARDLMGKASQSVQEATRKIDAIAGEQIAALPSAAALQIVPMTREIMRRLSMREGVRVASVQLTSFNDAIARIGRVQSDIAVLPVRERDTLTQVVDRAHALLAQIDAEARPGQPLAAERDMLKQANAQLNQASRLLMTDAPTEAAVVAAYPLRLKSEKLLGELDASLHAIRQQRQEAEGTLAKLQDALRVHRNEIATEESGGYARPKFAATADTLTTQSIDLKRAIADGNYAEAIAIAGALQREMDAQASALAAVRAERARIIGMADKSARYADTVGQWIKETLGHFHLDVTRGLQAQLHEIEAELRALVPMEDLEAMSGATALENKLEDTFRRATTARNEFEANRNKFDEITSLVNEISVQALAKQTDQSAADLAKINVAYWGALTPERLTQSTSALLKTWENEKAALVQIDESQLPTVLTRLQLVREAYLTTGGLQADAVRTHAIVETEKAQAITALAEESLNRLLQEMDDIATRSPSQAQQPHAFRMQLAELRTEMQHPTPNYRAVGQSVVRVRKEVETFLGEYRQRLQEAQSQLAILNAQLDQDQQALSALDDDPRVDFAPLSVPVLNTLGRWQQTLASEATLPFDEANNMLAQARQIDMDAQQVLESAVEVSKHVAQRTQAAQMSLAELNGVMTSAQAGLSAMTELGSERWGNVLLDGARQAMTEALEWLNRLQQPNRRLSPDEAVLAADRIGALVSAARERADEAHADIAKRVTEYREKQSALQETLHAAEQTLANAGAGSEHTAAQQAAYAELRANVAALQGRALEAGSFAEGLDAITQATQHARQFIVKWAATRSPEA
jgi:hypothetical protein